jgi:hypothetical protein
LVEKLYEFRYLGKVCHGRVGAESKNFVALAAGVSYTPVASKLQARRSQSLVRRRVVHER